MGRGAALIFLLIACCGCADAAQNTSTAGRTSTYVRSTAQQPLSLQHPVLRRHKSHPHAPEQIHLTIAGPGSISVSWVRSACSTFSWAQPVMWRAEAEGPRPCNPRLHSRSPPRRSCRRAGHTSPRGCSSPRPDLAAMAVSAPQQSFSADGSCGSCSAVGRAAPPDLSERPLHGQAAGGFLEIGSTDWRALRPIFRQRDFQHVNAAMLCGGRLCQRRAAPRRGRRRRRGALGRTGNLLLQASWAASTVLCPGAEQTLVCLLGI